MFNFSTFLENATVKAPKPLPYKLHNNYAKANVDFADDGYWYEEVFQYIPIEQIKFDPWNNERAKDNLNKLVDTKSMPPVIASFDSEKQKYILTDGNHRTNAAKELGYTHVPAIVSLKRTTAPKSDAGTEKYRTQTIGWMLGNKIRYIKSVDGIDVKNVTDNTCDLIISTFGIQEENIYQVTLRRNGSIIIADFNGQKFTGDIPHVASQIALRIKGIEETK
jgi:hypothetical protein